MEAQNGPGTFDMGEKKKRYAATLRSNNTATTNQVATML